MGASQSITSFRAKTKNSNSDNFVYDDNFAGYKVPVAPKIQKVEMTKYRVKKKDDGDSVVKIKVKRD